MTESGSSLTKGAEMRAYSFVFRLGVLVSLVLLAFLAAGWKWGPAIGH